MARPQAQGNEQFKIGNYAGAVEHYTKVSVLVRVACLPTCVQTLPVPLMGPRLACTQAIEANDNEIVYFSNRSAAYAAIGTVKV